MQRNWWKDAVVYQVWPASFKDSNDDGVGDLRGIIDSLDHIQSLGANTLWVSPIYSSPQVDFGYDISDYESIYPIFGSIKDVDDLIKACHDRNIKILMDLVVNHTSDAHKWFQESRSSKTNPKRDWYIWRSAKHDKSGRRLPPNNWRSNFTGSAWTWDEKTQEYYLHLFASAQPDLNWDCPELRQAVYDSALKFWLEKGIDGFRVDTMAIYSKNPDLPDAPVSDPTSPWQTGRMYYAHQPKVFDILQEMQQLMSRYGDKMTVGEFGSLSDTGLALQYVSEQRRCVGMGFQFETVCLGYSLNHWDIRPFTLREFKATFSKWQRFIEDNDGWTCVFLENHDIARSVSRFGCDSPEFRERSAKMLAMLQATATGTLFLYQGQDIGMTNVPAEWPAEEYKDISSQNYWKSVTRSTTEKRLIDKAMDNLRNVARDHGRTPMQWDDGPHGGFTSSKSGPWMRINDNYPEINVKRQSCDPTSVLSFWKRMLLLRKEHSDLFVAGTWRDIDPQSLSLMTYTKTSARQRALVILNFTRTVQPLALPEEFQNEEPRIVTIERWGSDVLGPFEGRLYIKETS
ncbi:alpha-glucosidase maltase [Exophiala xenobiotica]|nr:alpha-glucosidase maltase [Exophiala xenobiotica]